MLSTVVGTVAVLPATLAFLGRKHFPLPVTLVLAHVAASGFVVALAATDKFAGSSTFLLGKVTTLGCSTAVLGGHFIHGNFPQL